MLQLSMRSFCLLIWTLIYIVCCVSQQYQFFGEGIEATLNEWDITNQQSNEIAQAPVNISSPVQALDGVIDQAANIYYMMYIVFSDITLQFKGYIIPFQLNDTNISKYSPIPLPIEHDGVYDYNDKKLTINPETGELYVFAGRSVPNRPSALEYVLLTLKFDPVENQGSVTQVGTYSNMDPSKLELNDITYDSKREMLWVALDNLQNGDVNNFTMVHNQINVKTAVD